MEESLGKIISDNIGLTEALGGAKNATLNFDTKVNKKEVNKLKAEIKALDGDEVRIRAAVDRSSLKNIDGLADYAVQRAKDGKDISLGGVKELAFKNIADQAHGFTGVSAAIKEYNSLTDIASKTKLAETINGTNSSLGKYLTGLNGANTNIGNYAKSLAKATAKTFALQAATTAMNMAMGGLISAGITFLISGISKIVDGLITTEKELEEQRQAIISAGETARQTIDQIESDLESHTSTVKEVKDRYIELSQGVNNLGKANQNQGSLSSDEYAEFLDISNQLTDAFPTLKTGVLSTGDALTSLNGDAQTITSTLQDLLDTERALAAQKIADTFGARWEAYRVNSTDAITKHNEYGQKLEDLDNIYKLLQQLDSEQYYQFSDEQNEILTSLFEKVGIYNYDGTNLHLLAPELTDDVVSKIGEFVEEYRSEYNYQLELLSTDIQNQNRDFSQGIISSLYSFQSYRNLGNDTKYGSQLQSIINNALNSFHYDDYKGMSDKQLSKYLQTNIIDAVAKIDDNKVKQALIDLYDGTLSYSNFLEAWKKVTNYDNLNGSIDFSGWLKFDDFDIVETDEQAKQRLIDVFGGDNISQTDENILTRFVDNLEPEELDILEKLPLDKNSIKKGAEQFVADLSNDIQEELNQKENAATPLVSHIDLATNVESMTTAFDDLYKALDDYKENGLQDMDVSNLVNLNKEETFGNINGSTAAYEKFLSVMHNVNSTSDDVQDAFDELASAYIYHSKLAEQITEDNEDYIASQLEKNGVINSEEVAHQMLINKLGIEQGAINECINAQLSLNGQRITSANASELLQSATYSEIDALIGEANQAGITATALANYVLDKIDANNTSITTDGDIANLLALCEGLDGAIKLIKAFQDAKNAALTLEKSGNYTAATEANKAAEGYKLQIKALINSGTKVNSNAYGNNSSKRNPSGSPSSKDTFSQTFDWLERRLNKLTTQTERWAAIIENATDAKRLNTYYKKLQSGYSSLAKTYSTAANYYLKRAENVGLEKNYQNKVKNGTINLEEINDEKLANKISTYQDYWDKYQDYLDSYIETQEKLANIPLEKAASKIELLSDAFDLLDAQLDNISVKNYKNANTNLDKQIQNVKQQLDANKEARTATKANYRNAKSTVQKKANLGADDLAGNKNKQAASKKAIQNVVGKGNEINLSLYKEGSSGYKAAVKYNAALKAQKDAVNAAALSQEEYTKTLRENAKAKFDNISNYYSSRIGLRDNEISAIDNKISELEAAGKNVNKSYYEEQKKINNRKLNFYKDEKSALEESLKNIPKYTDEWYDAKDAIQECEDNISDCVEETYKLNNAINELLFDMYDDMADRIDRIISEQEFLQSLFTHEKMTDTDTGTFTDAGLAKLGSLSASYFAAERKVRNDSGLLNDLQDVKSNGKQSDGTYKLGEWTFNSLDDLQAKIDETYTTWQNDIKDTYNYESDIADLMKEKYNAELDMLQELIDAKKEALNAEKDLHDYKIQISEKTKDISTIRKQIAAYSGDSSEEGLAKLQKLQVELSKKEKDLSETEYERYISDQEDMLDKLYDEYEELVTKRLDDFMGLVHEGFNTVNTKMTTIDSYLSKIASENGYIEEFKKLFEENDIGKSVAKTTEDIEKDTRKNSGTEGAPPPPLTADPLPSKPKEDKKDPPKSKETPSLVGIKDTLTLDNASSRKFVKNYIKKNARKASKERSEYGAVNQAIYDNKAKAYDGKGKVLSSSALKGLARELQIKYDNSGKKGTLYKKLKSIKFPGFSKGGIVSVDDVRNQVINNGDTGLVSVHNGEGILTPLQTTLFGELTEKLPELNQALNLMGNMVDLPSLPTLSDIPTVKSNTTIGDMVFNIDLPNVTNPEEFVKAIQNEPKVQKALRAVTTDRLTGNGRLSVRNII